MGSKEILGGVAGSGVEVVKQTGAMAMRLAGWGLARADGARQNFSASVERAVYSPVLGWHLAQNHYENEKAAILQELKERRRDAQLVDLNARRWVKATLRTVGQVEQTGQPVSRDYLDQVAKIMQDCGIDPPAIENALSGLRENPIEPDDLPDGVYEQWFSRQ